MDKPTETQKQNEATNGAPHGVSVKRLVRRFPWGPVVAVHEVAEYQIVEYHPQIFENSCGTGRYDYDSTMFHSYIDGVDTNCSYKTFDSAIIGAVARKHDGLNSQAAAYFERMIGI